MYKVNYDLVNKGLVDGLQVLPHKPIRIGHYERIRYFNILNPLYRRVKGSLSK